MATDARAITQALHSTPRGGATFHGLMECFVPNSGGANEFAATTTRSPPVWTAFLGRRHGTVHGPSTVAASE